MVVNRDFVAFQKLRQLGLLERLAVHVDWRIVGPQHAFPHRAELVVAIDEEGFHGRVYHGATIGCAASVGSRVATPENIVPCSNHDAGAGWPQSVWRCGSVS